MYPYANSGRQRDKDFGLSDSRDGYDRPSFAGDVTVGWATTSEVTVDEAVERHGDGERNSELTSEREQRVAASQRLVRPLLETVATMNSQIRVVQLVKRADADHREAECRRCHHAADDQGPRRTVTQRLTADDTSIAVDGDEEDHESRHVHRDGEERRQHATQRVAEHLAQCILAA